MSQPRSIFLAGKAITTPDVLAVHNPYNGAEVGSTYLAGPALLETAMQGLAAGQQLAERLATHDKYNILHRIAAALLKRKEELAQTLSAESGKPIQYALAELDRTATTFSLAADHARTLRTDILPLDLASGLEGKAGYVRRVPIGPVLAISPFNFPLNLVAHKLAPAILAGNAFLLKPASSTPLSALALAEIILEAGYPAAAVNVLPFSAKHGNTLVADPRFSLLSFTGSPEVGWPLKALAGKKRVVLELGGDAAALIAEDADLDTAAAKCATGAFAYAGQICISIQRIVVVDAVYDAFRARFLKAVQQVQVGDPALPETVAGPLIDAQNFTRVSAWLDEAVAAGATYALQGNRDASHNLIYPTVLENLPRTTTIANNEAFAPLVELIRVPDFQAGLHAINQSRYGLQAGIFTHHEANIKAAWQQLQVGGVLVNEAPTLRVDAMPYGGIKDSGFGREGVQYAYEDMTELRLLVW